MKKMSKALGHPNDSGFEFVQEMLQGQPSYSINFDRLQFDANEGRYVIFELLLCEEQQGVRGVTPYSSHPSRYWYKNKALYYIAPLPLGDGYVEVQYVIALADYFFVCP